MGESGVKCAVFAHEFAEFRAASPGEKNGRRDVPSRSGLFL